MNYRFLTTETNSKASYIFSCFFTTSSVKQFVVTVQIFDYKFLFTIVFFGTKFKINPKFNSYPISVPNSNSNSPPLFQKAKTSFHFQNGFRNEFSFSKCERFPFSKKHNCKQKFVNKNLYSHYK